MYEMGKSMGINMKTFNEYEKAALTTKVYADKFKKIYPALKLSGEAGEVSEKIGKVLRDKDGEYTEEDIENIKKELGDVLWYVTALANDFGFSLEEIAETNLHKLLSRKVRGALCGSGDNR